MTSSSPQDFCPLAYGAALALGAMLSIAVPAAPVERARTVEVEARAGDAGRPSDEAAGESARPTERVLRERRARTAAARP